MANDYQATVDAYIAATRAGDADAYARCLAPDVLFFGSLTGVQLRGVSAVKGAFLAGGSILGFQFIQAFHVHGYGAEVALITPVQRPQDPEPLGFLTLLRMDDQARVKDIRLLWDPRRALLDTSPQHSFPIRSEVASFIQDFNEGNRSALLARVAPDVRYFGTIGGQHTHGPAAIEKVLDLARTSLGITRLVPLQRYGHGDHLGLLAEFHTHEEASTLGVIGLVFSPEGLIQELSVLWDPRPLFSR
jgi:ketosteroid isomerase-like protein